MSEATLSSHIGAMTDEETLVNVAGMSTAETAAAFVEGALHYTCRKCGIESDESVCTRLALGDRDAVGYFQYQLAVQVGNYVGTLDSRVKAVYFHDQGADCEVVLGGRTPEWLIHLVIWAEPRTDALASLITALDRALISRVADAIDAPGLRHLIAAKIVDDDQVWSPSGYSAVLRSLHQKPICVWPK